MNGREIKFRAWDNLNKKMLQVPTLYFDDTNYVASTIREHNNFLSVNEEAELMQFTGLRDKKRTEEYPNGQEIFEGDLVRHFEVITRVVIFKYGAFGYESENGFISYAENSWFKWEDGKSKEIEVIGNICGNPELMGEKL